MIDVSKFRGDRLELKWNLKGLEAVERTLSLVSEKNVAVQAGGCLGVFAKHLAQRFKTVYVFEPSEQFVDMTANAPEKNIIRFQAALGVRREMVNPVCTLRGYEGKITLHSGMTMLEAQKGVVPTLRLDDLGLQRCDLLYLDVEGYELNALLGAKHTIEVCKPVIAVEINRAIEIMGHKGEDVRALILSHGYKFEFRMHSDEVYVPCQM